MKKILIISTSPRKDGNSDTLAHEFERGALEAGNQVEYISLIGKDIHFCRGCMACLKTGCCVMGDDANVIVEKMYLADVIVWATPVYYYSVSGQMKVMIDRGNPLYDTDYHFTDVYLLATAAEDEPTTVIGARTALQGWVDCFERASLIDVVFVGGVNDKGDILCKREQSQACLDSVERSRDWSAKQFDAAHRRDHVDMVIEQSMEIARQHDVNLDMVYTIAAYHDTGLIKDRKTHHSHGFGTGECR